MLNPTDTIPAKQGARPRRRSLASRLLGYTVALAVMAGLAYLVVAQMPGGQGPGGGPGSGGRFGGGGRFERDAPVPVLTATAKSADVPVYFDGVGTVRALNVVTVRPQVDGKLLRLNFREGEDVERGFVLAEIDPVVYQAQLDQATAKKAQDEAQLANARLDLDRYVRLAQTNAATKQQADTQRALVAQLEALVKADQAAIDNARAYLDYTRIVAPIAGRTGIRLVDVGNLMRATDPSGIVVITQIRPISVIFTLPQQQLPAVNKAFAQGPLTALALGGDNRTIADRGVLQVIDNQVDQTTGTVRLRAEFPNKDLQLWPGQFVNVKLLVDTRRAVVVVPTAAVQRGPNGTFAYVVIDNSTVSVRPVAVAQQDDVRAVIASGLAHGERVVTSGFAQLTDGSRITVSSGEDTLPPDGEAGPPAPSGEPQSGLPRSGLPQQVPPRTGAQAAPSAGAAAPGGLPAERGQRSERRNRRSEEGGGSAGAGGAGGAGSAGRPSQ